MLALIVLDDGPHVLDALDRERLEERDHGDEFVRRLVAFAPRPGFQGDAVVGLELEAVRVDVEDDGALERPVQVREVLDVHAVLVPRRFLEQLPRDVGTVRVEFLDDGDGELELEVASSRSAGQVREKDRAEETADSRRRGGW